MSVVGPMSYGVYGSKSFFVGCTAAVAHWVLAIFYTRWEELDKRLDAKFGASVATAILIGLLMGFGVGLGLQIGQAVGEELGVGTVSVFAKWCTIGLSFGLSAGLLLRVGEFLSGTISIEGQEFPRPQLPGRLGSCLSALLTFFSFGTVFVVFGVPFGAAEAFGGGLVPGVLTGAALGLFVWFDIVLVFFVGINPAALPPALFQGAAAGLVFGLVSGVFVGVGVGGGTGLPGFAVAGLGGVVGVALGGLAGLFVGRRMRPLLNVLEGVLPYLRAMLVPVGGFAVGYGLVALAFAGLFASAYRLEPARAFADAPAAPSFWHFLHFSLMTMTSLDYGGMEAGSRLTRSIASVEAVMGIAWMVVVFAAVTAYLQPRFVRINAEKPITKDEKMALARRWVDELFNRGNLGLVDEILVPDAEVFANARAAKAPGPEAVKQFVSALRSAIPDLTVVVNTQEAEYFFGTRTSWTGRGLHEHRFDDLEPTGGQVTLTGEATFAIGPDGKATRAELLIGSWSPQKKAE